MSHPNKVTIGQRNHPNFRTMMKTTRSSRLFIILLHLVGVRRQYHQSSQRKYSYFTTDWFISFLPSYYNRRIRSGILGVQTWPVTMEQIDLRSTSFVQSSSSMSSSLQQSAQKIKATSEQTLSSSIEKKKVNSQHNDDDENDVQNDDIIIWLQDSVSQTPASDASLSASSPPPLCLSPTGYFSECGDATLWLLQQNFEHDKSTKRSKEDSSNEWANAIRNVLLDASISRHVTNQNSVTSIRDTSTSTKEEISIPKWTFQVVDHDFSRMSQRTIETATSSSDCLQHNSVISTKISKKQQTFERTQPGGNAVKQTATIDVKQCSKMKRSSKLSTLMQQLLFTFPHAAMQDIKNDHSKDIWFVNSDGYLQISTSNNDNTESGYLCLGRDERTSQAVLVPCGVTNFKSNAAENEKESSIRPVQFSFIRYRAVAPTQAQYSHPPVGPPGSSSQLTFNAKIATSDLTSDASGTSNRHLHRRHAGGRKASLKRNRTSSRTINTNLPSNRDIASQRSNVNVLHPTLALAERIRYDNFHHSNPILFVSASAMSSPSSSKAATMMMMSARHHSSTHPNRKKDQSQTVRATIANEQHTMSRVRTSIPRSDNSHKHGSTLSKPQSIASISKVSSVSANKNNEQVTTSAGKIHHHRIHRHPYIDAATNNIWSDPQTGLEYPTDLCEYLGWDRKEKGRQTLTGVGVYRKGYVIKVYGIAFYVSKRDVLADPSFVKYADLTAPELMARQDFYEHLRVMGKTSSSDPDSKEGRFDRTILLKTNMQLAAETMRSSLQADWSYLTKEMKTTLVGSSMETRPADETMLRLIQSPDNPSRCSCSQTAPPEYNANPDCCARGTELAFTWLKNDDLEVRLNGRLVVRFPRPDIAKGIFYEYLRTDDPMSTEFRDHVVDGFPFLLSPLSQVQGINTMMSERQQHISSSDKKETPQRFHRIRSLSNAVGGAVGSLQQNVVGVVTSTMEFVGEPTGYALELVANGTKSMITSIDNKREWLLGNMAAAPGTFVKIIRNDEDTLRQISEFRKSVLNEADQSRKWMANQVMTIPETVGKIFQGDDEVLHAMLSFRDSILEMIPFVSSASSNANQTSPSSSMAMNDSAGLNMLTEDEQNIEVESFGYSQSPWLADNDFTLHTLDEIGPMRINRTMDKTRQFVLSLGHLYLLLLFIVSFPGSYSTSTKLVVIRKGICTSYQRISSDSESERTSIQDENNPAQEWDDESDFLSCGKLSISKEQRRIDHRKKGSMLLATAEESLSPSSKRRRNMNILTRTAQNILPKRRSKEFGNNYVRLDSPTRSILNPRIQQPTNLSSNSAENPLKKKSLSYFL